MIKKVISNFSIEQICESGQCFRMRKLTDGYVEVIAHGKYLIVSQNENEVTFDCSQEDYGTVWKEYFDIDQGTDYDKIISSIDNNDLYLKNASKFGSGIRILNQDLFEMIISFIISQRNNIKRIRGCVSRLCEKYGEEKVFINDKGEKIIYYDFPKPEALASANIEDIKSLGVGYRDAYIKRAAEDVVSGKLDLEKLKQMDYQDAREELLKLFGVGVKVADCICLFALHHIDAFPIDTHISSILNNEYNGEFPFYKYEGYAGILQQYMFFYDLNV